MEAALLAPRRARPYFLTGILIDDSPFPRHDEVAYRCTAEALRLAPRDRVHRRELARRHLLRTRPLQALQGVANLLLAPSLLLGGLADRAGVVGLPFKALAWVIALPGVVLHVLFGRVLVAVLQALRGEAIATRVADSPRDDALREILERYRSNSACESSDSPVDGAPDVGQ